MNKGNASPSVRSNAAPGPYIFFGSAACTLSDAVLVCYHRPWRTYSQRARALGVPLRPNQPTGSVELVIPSRAVTPFASMSLNASVPQYQHHSAIIRPEPGYVSNPNQQIGLDSSSEPDYHAYLHNHAFQSPVASEGDFIVPASSETDELDATPAKSQGLQNQTGANPKSNNQTEPNLTSETDELEATPTKLQVCRKRPDAIPKKQAEIDLAGSSNVEVIQATPKTIQGGGYQSEVARMRDITFAFTLFLQKTADNAKGSSKPKKTTYTAVPLPSTQKPFDTSCNSLTSLKTRLFLLASEIDPDDDERKGNAAILKSADARNLVKIVGIVKNHERFGKGKTTAITTDAIVTEFCNAVKTSPLKECGIAVTMENPTKAAQDAEDAILKKKARLRAQNEIKNVPTTTTDLARCAPEDEEDLQLKALQLRHGSMKTRNNEGYRLFHPKDYSLKMDIGYRHLLIWAKYLAQGIEGVSIEMPPSDHAEFVWKDINPKRPLLSTPLPKTKRSKVQETVVPFKRGIYDEMQGTHIVIDFNTLHSIRHFHTIEDYLRYCDFGLDAIKEIATVLRAYSVVGFESFLYPDVMNVRDVQSWGISWTSAMELFTHPRRFYQSVIDHASLVLSKGKMRALDSGQGHPAPIASTSAVPHQGPSMATASGSCSIPFYSQEF